MFPNLKSRCGARGEGAHAETQGSRRQDKCVAKVGADRRDAPRFRRIPRSRGRLCRSSGSFWRNNPTIFYSGADCALQVRCHTKSRLLLDFSRGAQRVTPVCRGLMGRMRESRPVSTRPRRPCPPFPLQSPISKGQWYHRCVFYPPLS